jgi:hypothetical protein
MKIVIDIPEEIIADAKTSPNFFPTYHFGTLWEAVKNGTPLPKGHGRKFDEIVVEYPPAELCTYPEYRGKPYFSIKYEENGEHFIGFGTYKPEVLSRYLQEYFIAPTITEADAESENQE